MATVPNAAQDRIYPMPAPPDDRRFTLGLVFAVVQVLIDHGYPGITAGGDLVALQQAIYQFIYRSPADGTANRDRVIELLDGRGPVPPGMDREVAAAVRRIAQHFAEHGCLTAAEPESEICHGTRESMEAACGRSDAHGEHPISGTR